MLNINNIGDIPFDVKHLENNEWPLNDDMRKYMGEESQREHEETYNKAQAEVVFNNIHVEWDSCDCGNGYGCSHGSWPFRGHFGNDPEAKIDWEDDGISLSKGKKSIYLSNLESFTIGQFIDMCKIVGIELQYAF